MAALHQDGEVVCCWKTAHAVNWRGSTGLIEEGLHNPAIEAQYIRCVARPSYLCKQSYGEVISLDYLLKENDNEEQLDEKNPLSIYIYIYITRMLSSSSTKTNVFWN